ncbi:S1C family serine protease [Micromonospora jinlongensis]|uniref:S1C family serine protease n=1 Tax=Micromonospora jinlongensis TaxID=1287877 RepID=UPI0015CD83E3|nr:trypsin-like peptidase domain-containing protein [Micromonospora jinlongensis]
MTAGFGSGDGRPAGAGPDDASGSMAGRPGPLPPRIEPQPASTWSTPPSGGTDPARPVPAPRPERPVPPNTGQWGPPPTPFGSAGQHGPGAPAVAPGPGAYPPAASGFPGVAGYPLPGPAGAAPSTTGGHPGGPAYWPASPPTDRPTRRRWPAALATVAVVVLAAVAGLQAYQLDRLGDRLADTDRRLAQAQDGDLARLDSLDKRAEALEKQAGAAFNPEAVASAVLPSVFRVRAGEFTGTAFAVGKPASGGGTNLFTNFHVVEAVWDGGGREVFLERTSQRFPATIVKVDKTNDVAHLRATGKFTGLVTAPAAAKSGQQIVVVGAPLGLEDSVTTGVVSALRPAQGGSGPAIQFDAPINPGNSGGPVINGSKEVVGIATAKARNAEGIGLAVPIKVACDGFKIC